MSAYIGQQQEYQLDWQHWEGFNGPECWQQQLNAAVNESGFAQHFLRYESPLLADNEYLTAATEPPACHHSSTLSVESELTPLGHLGLVTSTPVSVSSLSPPLFGDATQPQLTTSVCRLCSHEHTDCTSDGERDIRDSSVWPIAPATKANKFGWAIDQLMGFNLNTTEAAFSRKAIESLVKRLKDRQTELDALLQAVTSKGTVATQCVTVQRSLDGRLQVASRKGFPHVIYARIWRWPLATKNELHSQPLFCLYGYERRKVGGGSDFVCVNPYHYQRMLTTADEDEITSQQQTLWFCADGEWAELK